MGVGASSLDDCPEGCGGGHPFVNGLGPQVPREDILGHQDLRGTLLTGAAEDHDVHGPTLVYFCGDDLPFVPRGRGKELH